MGLIESVHGGYVHDRRTRRLNAMLSSLIPQGARVLDVGCGDGLLARRILDTRPDLAFEGIDVLVREGTHVPVTYFDGRTIPDSVGRPDVVMFVDVLHHTDDPMVLLREAARVAGKAVVIKDHTRDGLLAGPTLRFMDYVGNARHGVVLPYNYWPEARWRAAFGELGLNVKDWVDDLKLYPVPLDWVFGRSLHFIAVLEPAQLAADLQETTTGSAAV